MNEAARKRAIAYHAELRVWRAEKRKALDILRQLKEATTEMQEALARTERARPLQPLAVVNKVARAFIHQLEAERGRR